MSAKAAGTTISAAAARMLPIVPIAEFVATSLEKPELRKRFKKGKDISAVSKAIPQQSYVLTAILYHVFVISDAFKNKNADFTQITSNNTLLLRAFLSCINLCLLDENCVDLVSKNKFKSRFMAIYFMAN